MIYFISFRLTEPPEWVIQYIETLADMTRTYLISKGVTIEGGVFRKDDDNEPQDN